MARKQGAESAKATVTAETQAPETPPEEATTAEPAPLPLAPEAVDGIQVNFCKNPSCGNFGMPAEGTRNKRGFKAGQDPATKRSQQDTRYKPSGMWGPWPPALTP